MPAIRLAAVSIDTDDPPSVADFYRELLELEVFFESEDFIALKGGPTLLTFQRVAEHRVPQWPEGEVPKQLHLELSVDDMDAAEARAIELGATKAAEQPAADKWRVLIDPAGHPFCVTTLIPEV